MRARGPRTATGAPLLLFALLMGGTLTHPGLCAEPTVPPVETRARAGQPAPRALPPRYERILRPRLSLQRQGGRPFAPGEQGEAAALDGLPEGTGFQELASNEIVLDAPLPSVPGYDGAATALGRSGTALCVLAVEDFVLRSLRSVDGGASFAAEVDVTGGPGAGAVLDVVAELADDNTIYAAMIVADPNGDRSLRVARSTDTCQTWSAPQDVVGGGSPEHGVTDIALDTGSAGFVAVAFLGRDGTAPYALASGDSGANWTSPVRLDPGNAPGFVAPSSIDLAVDSTSNNIYVAYAQDVGTGSSMWFTRSSDGGASFDAEANLDSITPDKVGSDLPTVGVASNGDVLIAYWDELNSGTIYVARSTNDGQTYGLVHDEPIGSGAALTNPVLGIAPGNAVVQLLLPYNGGLWHNRSTDNGATFLVDSVVLNSTTDADPAGIRPFPEVAVAYTDSGTWVIAWSDTRNDGYASTRTDVFARRSTDEGATWLADQRVDSDAAGAAGSTVGGVVPTGGDDFFVVWSDRRGTAGRALDLYASRYSAAGASFAADARIDADAGQASAESLGDPTVATDGANGVYVAFAARGTGHEMDIHVARSSDGGYTFAAPVRVGSSPVGEHVEAVPYVAASSDGNVYLVYYADNPTTGLRELRLNRSSDFGATWQPSDLVLDSWSHDVGYWVESFDYPNVQLEALSGGTVYVAWSDNVDVYLYRSFDGGLTHTIADVDQDIRGFNRYPALCAQGNQIALAIMTPTESFAFFSVWGTASGDGGDSWSTLTQLRSEATNERAIYPVITCDGIDKAVVLWMDLRSESTWELFANRWNGSGWDGDVKVSGPAGVDHFWPAAVHVGAGVVVVGFEDLAGSIYAARSVDGGATFPGHQRLDDAAPEPGARSDTPRVSSQGSEAWVFWRDASAGADSIASRSSADAGLTYGPVRRVNRESPQGAFTNTYFILNAATAAAGGAGFIAWSGPRGDLRRDVLLNAVDADDGDRDSFGAGADCDNADPGVWSAPQEVLGLEASKPAAGTTRLSWASQDASAGTSTVYDVVTGLASELRQAGDYTLASCLAAGIAGSSYDDTRGAPPPLDVHYYLLRAKNSCGISSYGDSPLAPDPRDDLDAAGPCP